MKILECTDMVGNPIYININSILYMQPDRDTDGHIIARIFMAEGITPCVKHTCEQVVVAIQKALSFSALTTKVAD